MSAACARNGTSRPAAAILGEPCALAASAPTEATEPRVLIEVGIATFEKSDSAPTLPAPTQRWSDDPRTEVAWSARALFLPGAPARLSWAAAPPSLVAGQLTAKVLAAPTPESVRIEVELNSGAAPAHTTLVVRDQQTIFLALPGATGAVVVITPYLSNNQSQLARLRDCKPGPWVDVTMPLATR